MMSTTTPTAQAQGEHAAAPRDAQLQALLDKDALYELAVRYARAIDRRDRALLLSVYHEDAVDDHGVMFKGSAAAFADWQPEVMARFEVTAHYIMNTSYRLDGDHAQGELYFVAYHRTKAPDAKEVVIGGRYLDRYERRANVWKIAHRTLVWDFSREHPLDPAQRDFLASLGESGCGSDDASFGLLPLFKR
ncbi:SnoaL-like protein [Paraburkholderia unamae]|uniref:SnoaL-like protein n=2 Tax=Paraburkholderia unamae TaxID=219649 RepID=A0ABX5KE72_9BURK|nr:SnoaL-like protein [Paraburkholderia unamae]